jgi:hypothetical protein
MRIRTAEDELYHLLMDSSHEIFCELIGFEQCIIGKRLVRIDLLNNVVVSVGLPDPGIGWILALTTITFSVLAKTDKTNVQARYVRQKTDNLASIFTAHAQIKMRLCVIYT